MDRPCARRNVVQIARNNPNYHSALRGGGAPGEARREAGTARRLAQSLEGRRCEAAERAARPTTAKSRAEPTGCKQPVGTATALTGL